MRLMQFAGPFKRGEIIGTVGGSNITAPSRYDREYVHIGIQIPDSPHIAYVIKVDENDKILRNDFDPVLKIDAINGENVASYEYFINYNDILEFTDLADKSYRITALQDISAEAIIDIAYDILDV